MKEATQDINLREKLSAMNTAQCTERDCEHSIADNTFHIHGLVPFGGSFHLKRKKTMEDNGTTLSQFSHAAFEILLTACQ